MDKEIILFLRGVDITRIMLGIMTRSQMEADPVERAALVELYDRIKEKYVKCEQYEKRN